MSTNFLFQVCYALWGYFLELWYWLIMGFVAGGLAQEFFPKRFLKGVMGGKSLKSISTSAVMGVAIDICSCGILPVAAGIYRGGASCGATLAFLNATPWLGISVTILLFVLLGPFVASAFLILSIIIAIVNGWVVDHFVPSERTHLDGLETDEFGHKHKFIWSMIYCELKHENWSQENLLKRLGRSLDYSWDLVKDILPWIVLGLVGAGIIEVLIPRSFIETYLGYRGWMPILMSLVIGSAVYVCSAATLPMAAALITKGASVGSIFIIMISGIATNFSTIGTVWKVMGKKTEIINLITMVTLSVLCGLFLNLLWYGTIL